MLLYLVKRSRPNQSTCTRELSKVMDGAMTIKWNELLRVIKYTIDTKETGLRMDPTNDEKWHLEAFSDVDFAGDKDTRISVTGYLFISKVSPYDGGRKDNEGSHCQQQNPSKLLAVR